MKKYFYTFFLFGFIFQFSNFVFCQQEVNKEFVNKEKHDELLKAYNLLLNENESVSIKKILHKKCAEFIAHENFVANCAGLGVLAMFLPIWFSFIIAVSREYLREKDPEIESLYIERNRIINQAYNQKSGIINQAYNQKSRTINQAYNKNNSTINQADSQKSRDITIAYNNQGNDYTQKMNSINQEYDKKVSEANRLYDQEVSEANSLYDKTVDQANKTYDEEVERAKQICNQKVNKIKKQREKEKNRENALSNQVQNHKDKLKKENLILHYTNNGCVERADLVDYIFEVLSCGRCIFSEYSKQCNFFAPELRLFQVDKNEFDNLFFVDSQKITVNHKQKTYNFIVPLFQCKNGNKFVYTNHIIAGFDGVGAKCEYETFMLYSCHTSTQNDKKHAYIECTR